MVICSNECSPCCDFCIYARHIVKFINGKTIKIGVEGCDKYSDEHHQSMARGLGYCKDFYCEKKNGGSAIIMYYAPPPATLLLR